MPYPRAKPPAGGIKANYPGFIEPSLATSIDKVPAGERWVHEIKFDGYRVQVHLRDAAVKVFTRRGNDWTNRFRKIAADAWNINAGSAIIDGEVVVPAADGTTDFSVLQNDYLPESAELSAGAGHDCTAGNQRNRRSPRRETEAGNRGFSPHCCRTRTERRRPGSDCARRLNRRSIIGR
jgi:ATP dependent DNA ligase domain